MLPFQRQYKHFDDLWSGLGVSKLMISLSWGLKFIQWKPIFAPFSTQNIQLSLFLPFFTFKSWVFILHFSQFPPISWVFSFQRGSVFFPLSFFEGSVFLKRWKKKPGVSVVGKIEEKSFALPWHLVGLLSGAICWQTGGHNKKRLYWI